MNTTKTLMALAAGMMASLAGAATFPSAGGDIAANDATGWNGSKPGASEEAAFDKAGTYTASADVSFGSLALSVGGVEFDLTSGNHKVSVSGYTGPQAADAQTVFKGGALHFKSAAEFAAQAAWINNTKLTLTDGCTVDNVSTFYLSKDGAVGTQALIEKSASVSANALRIAQNWGRSSTLELATGGKLTVGSGTSYMTTGKDANHTTETKLLVHDMGSSVSFGGSLLVCSAHPNESVRVYDDAAFSGTYIDLGGYANALVEVKDGATMTLTNDLTMKGTSGLTRVDNATATVTNLIIGHNTQEDASKRDNHVEIVNGATLTASSVSFRGNDSSLLVSNSTFAVGSFELGKYASSTNNTAIFSGSEVALAYSSNPFGSKAADNTLVLDDGATWIFDVANYQFMTAARSALKVTRGAKFSNVDADKTEDNWTYVGYNWGSEYDCRIEVSDDGEMHTARFGVMGYGTELVVSNGLVTVGENCPSTATKFGLNVGYTIPGKESAASTGCRVTLQGSTPRIRAMNNQVVHLQGDSVLRYEIPEAGYAEGFAPVEALRLALVGSASALEISCDAWAAAAREAGKSRKVVLFRGTENLSQAVVDWLAAQELNLPDNVKLIVSQKEIALRASGCTGLSIIL